MKTRKLPGICASCTADRRQYRLRIFLLNKLKLITGTNKRALNTLSIEERSLSSSVLITLIILRGCIQGPCLSLVVFFLILMLSFTSSMSSNTFQLFLMFPFCFSHGSLFLFDPWDSTEHGLCRAYFSSSSHLIRNQKVYECKL